MNQTVGPFSGDGLESVLDVQYGGTSVVECCSDGFDVFDLYLMCLMMYLMCCIEVVFEVVFVVVFDVFDVVFD